MPSYTSSNSNITVLNRTANNVVSKYKLGTLSYVHLAATSQDGKLMLLEDNAYNIYIFNTTSFARISSLYIGYYAYSAVFSNNDKYVYLGTSNNLVVVVNLTSNTIMKTIPALYPYVVVMSPNGKLIYTTDAGNNNITVINTTSNTRIANISLNKGTYVYGVAPSPDGKTLYALGYYSSNSKINITAINATSPFNIEATHAGVFSSGDPYSYAYPGDFWVSPNDSVLYVSLYNSGYYLYKIPTSTYIISGVSFPTTATEGFATSDGKSAYFGQGSNSYIVYVNLSSFVESTISIPSATYAVTGYTQISDMPFRTSSSSYSFSAPTLFNSTGGCATIFTPSFSSGNLQAGERQTLVYSSSNNCTFTTFTESGLPSGTPWSVTFNSVTRNSTATSMTIPTAAGTFSFSVPSAIHPANQSLDCNSTYAPTPSSNTDTAGTPVSISFSVSSSSCITTFTEYGLPPGYNWNVTYDSIQQREKTTPYIFVPSYTSSNSNITVLNRTANNVVSKYKLGTLSYVHLAATSQDGKLMLLEDNAYNIYIFNTTSFARISSLYIGYYAYSAVFSNNDKYVYLGTSNNLVVVVNLTSNTIMKTIPALYPYVVVMSPNGKLIYTTDAGNNNITVINTTSNTRIANISLNKGTYVYGVAPSPDGKTLYALGYYSSNSKINITAINATSPFNIEATHAGVFSSGDPYSYAYPGDFWVSPNDSVLYVSLYNSGYYLYKIPTSTYIISGVSFPTTATEGFATSDGKSAYFGQGSNSYIVYVNLSSFVESTISIPSATYAVTGYTQISDMPFRTSSSSYSFSIPTLSNSSGIHTSTYTPTPATGSLQAGYIIPITFTASYS